MTIPGQTEINKCIKHIEEEIDEIVDVTYLRWYAIKLFERDEVVRKELIFL